MCTCLFLCFLSWQSKNRNEMERNKVLAFFSSLKASFYLSFKDNKLNTHTIAKTLRCMLQATNMELDDGENIINTERTFMMQYSNWYLRLFFAQPEIFFLLCKNMSLSFYRKAKNNTICCWLKEARKLLKKMWKQKCESFCFKLTAWSFFFYIEVWFDCQHEAFNTTWSTKH